MVVSLFFLIHFSAELNVICTHVVCTLTAEPLGRSIVLNSLALHILHNPLGTIFSCGLIQLSQNLFITVPSFDLE